MPPAHLLRRACLCVGACIALSTSLATSIHAQTVGPGAVAGPVNVPAGTTTIVGSTTITSTGTNAGVNATSTGTAILDPTGGPSPGAILVQTANGNALQALTGGT